MFLRIPVNSVCRSYRRCVFTALTHVVSPKFDEGLLCWEELVSYEKGWGSAFFNRVEGLV